MFVNSAFHTCLYIHYVHDITQLPPCLTDNTLRFQITSSHFLSPYFTLPINLEQDYVGFICAVNLTLCMVRLFFKVQGSLFVKCIVIQV